MKTSLFITGASGFVAGNLLRKINPKEFANVYCLSRKESPVMADIAAYSNVTFIKGGLEEAHVYAPYLSSTDTVLHLAAVTGKAKPEDYFDVNARGTEVLLTQCEKAGVRNFLNVSTIAVKFKDISRYYYALSKLQAEEAVKKSGLHYLIVRPTIVVGKQSPIWNNFFKLAAAPVTLLFGDGKVNIQPIYIEDLTDLFLTIIRENIFSYETIELGGPEVITIEDFIARIRRYCFKKNPRVVHIPLKYLVPLVAYLEKRFYSVLPFTSGQLSSFRFDGTAESNEVFQVHRQKMKKIDEMIRRIMTGE
jgi:nucleoside-diphosphate-sugar epimerase